MNANVGEGKFAKASILADLLRETYGERFRILREEGEWIHYEIEPPPPDYVTMAEQEDALLVARDAA